MAIEMFINRTSWQLIAINNNELGLMAIELRKMPSISIKLPLLAITCHPWEVMATRQLMAIEGNLVKNALL